MTLCGGGTASPRSIVQYINIWHTHQIQIQDTTVQKSWLVETIQHIFKLDLVPQLQLSHPPHCVEINNNCIRCLPWRVELKLRNGFVLLFRFGCMEKHNYPKDANSHHNCQVRKCNQYPIWAHKCYCHVSGSNRHPIWEHKSYCLYHCGNIVLYLLSTQTV